MPLSAWILFPALTMSLGWGLRGYIGGGPLGAMIPGAMVALALCLLLRRTPAESAVVAAFGAVGVGFGGQETYGQTVGYSIALDTMWFGLFGLGLKGAVWGLLGGAVIGIPLDQRRLTSKQLTTGLALMVAGTWLGWKLLNEPKLIYFSNRLDRPRAEIWAGLALGALLLLLWLARLGLHQPRRFALYGFLGGGLGFYSGALLQSLGRQHAPTLTSDYWKLMEFTFGFLFGAAWGYCAWRDQPTLVSRSAPCPEPTAFGWWTPLVIPLGALAISEVTPGRFGYTIVGAALLAIAAVSIPAARHIAITITSAAFFVDLLEARDAWNAPLFWGAVATATLAVALWLARRQTVLATFHVITWIATGDAVYKAFGPEARQSSTLEVQLAFIILAILATLLAARTTRAEAPLTHRLAQGLDERVALGD